MTEENTNNLTEDQDKIEGEDNDPNSNTALITYPIDEILVRQASRTVGECVRRINQEMYILDPDFQRSFVWDPIKQSRLIQSAIMRIPLPVFYLAEQEDGKLVIVDGLQRFTTFQRYLNNMFPLKFNTKDDQLNVTNAPFLQYNKKYFKDLPVKIQNRIEDTNLSLYLIDPKAPGAVKLDIFERVNSGVSLTKQQMRNALFVGKATRWLKEQAECEEFLQATSKSLNSKRMRDREAINRFCGFAILGFEKYRGEMDVFLTETLRKMNTMSDEELQQLSTEFKQSMRNNFLLFEKFAFRRHERNTERRNLINIALFDVFSTLMRHYTESQVEAKKEALKDMFYQLLVDQRFSNAINLGTNGLLQVNTRFQLLQVALNKVMGNADAH